jgi:N-acetyltransferase 10
MSLCGMSFRDFSPSLALGVLERSKTAEAAAAAAEGEEGEEGGAMSGAGKAITAATLPQYFSVYDLKRIHSYAGNLVDFHVILDLIPSLARLWFTGCIPVSLSALQKAILLGTGLQSKVRGFIVGALSLLYICLMDMFSLFSSLLFLSFLI